MLVLTTHRSLILTLDREQGGVLVARLGRAKDASEQARGGDRLPFEHEAFVGL